MAAGLQLAGPRPRACVQTSSSDASKVQSVVKNTGWSCRSKFAVVGLARTAYMRANERPFSDAQARQMHKKGKEQNEAADKLGRFRAIKERAKHRAGAVVQ